MVVVLLCGSFGSHARWKLLVTFRMKILPTRLSPFKITEGPSHSRTGFIVRFGIIAMPVSGGQTTRNCWIFSFERWYVCRQALNSTTAACGFRTAGAVTDLRYDT
jgi:hypothetical protein